jgi:ribosome-associated toxin RatA of RatAB toxin-antitoxin module
MLALVTCLLLTPPNPNPWEQVKDSDEIKVWVRDVPGKRVRELRAEAVMPAPAARVFDVLQDVEHYLEFMPYLVEAKKVGPAPGGHYEYQRLEPPVVDTRDYTVLVRMEADAAAGLYQRSWKIANDKGPPKRDDAVRVEVNEGAWTIERIDEQSTRVSYYLYTDPGGSIPAWLANKANTTSIPDLFAAVRKRAKDPTWKR